MRRQSDVSELAIHAEAHRRQRGGAGRAQKEGAMAVIFSIFPLILLPVGIYAIMGFAAGSDPAAFRAGLEQIWFHVPMASREDNVAGANQIVQWAVTRGDGLVLAGLLLLFIELLKSTSTGTAAIFNHALSMLVFIICLVAFLLHPAFATTTFFLIMTMSLLDVLAGVVVTIISARRDVEFGSQ